MLWPVPLGVFMIRIAACFFFFCDNISSGNLAIEMQIVRLSNKHIIFILIHLIAVVARALMTIKINWIRNVSMRNAHSEMTKTMARAH